MGICLGDGCVGSIPRIYAFLFLRIFGKHKTLQNCKFFALTLTLRTAPWEMSHDAAMAAEAGSRSSFLYSASRPQCVYSKGSESLSSSLEVATAVQR